MGSMGIHPLDWMDDESSSSTHFPTGRFGLPPNSTMATLSHYLFAALGRIPSSSALRASETPLFTRRYSATRRHTVGPHVSRPWESGIHHVEDACLPASWHLESVFLYGMNRPDRAPRGPKLPRSIEKAVLSTSALSMSLRALQPRSESRGAMIQVRMSSLLPSLLFRCRCFPAGCAV